MKTLLALALMARLCGGALVQAADSPAPAVDPAKLAAFIQKWQSPPPYEYPQALADQPLLLAALAKDPRGPWSGYLDMVASDARFQIRQVKWTERKAWAAALLSTLQQAEQIQEQLRTAGAMTTNRPIAFVFERGRYPETKAFLSLEAGQNLAVLKADAQRELASNKDTNDWNYGNVVFHANEVLGRIAVKEGNFAEARRCLRATTSSAGSPQLNSFGPDFVLPRELLEHSDKEDRDTVLAFLNDVRKWCGDPAKKPEANSRRVAQNNLLQLDKWRQIITDGKIPDDPKWR